MSALKKRKTICAAACFVNNLAHLFISEPLLMISHSTGIPINPDSRARRRLNKNTFLESVSFSIKSKKSKKK